MHPEALHDAHLSFMRRSPQVLREYRYHIVQLPTAQQRSGIITLGPRTLTNSKLQHWPLGGCFVGKYLPTYLPTYLLLYLAVGRYVPLLPLGQCEIDEKCKVDVKM